MIADLESVLTEFQSTWDCEETPTTIRFSEDDISASDRRILFEQVTEFRSIIDGRNLVLKINETRDVFEYRLSWEPNDNVTIIHESDQGTDGSDIFQLERAIEALDRIRDSRIRNGEDLSEILDTFIENDYIEVSFVYRIDTDDVAGVVEGEIDEPISTNFYLHKATFLSEIDTVDLESLRELFIPDLNKQVFIIQNIDGPTYGNHLSFFTLSTFGSNQFKDFVQLRTTLKDTLTNVGRECVIDRFEETYIPPDYFEFESVNDGTFVENLQGHLSGFRLIYAIFSFSNVVRTQSTGWQIRINGKKILEQQVNIDKSEGDWKLQIIKSGNVDTEVNVTVETVNSFVDVFEWAYAVRVTDRLSVLRNIITLYTTSIEGLIQEIGDIHESSKSNFKFYAEQSVDEFIGMQQEVSNYLLETQREFSELRRDLANSLSRDLFRVFGFLIVTWVGIFLQLEKITPIRNALSISLLPIIFYLGLNLRAVYGLGQQFRSLENSRDAYQDLYKRQMNKELFQKVVDSSQEERISGQFKTDERIYYVVFGGLLIISLYAIVDLQIFDGPLSDIVRSLHSGTN